MILFGRLSSRKPLWISSTRPSCCLVKVTCIGLPLVVVDLMAPARRGHPTGTASVSSSIDVLTDSKL